MTELQPGDRVQILGLDGTLRTKFAYTITRTRSLYTDVSDDLGSKLVILTAQLRKVER